MKNHLKRIASPRTWAIDRKNNKFITRPRPGAHSFENGLALGVIIRDHLKLASTMSEVKKTLNNNEVLVDGKRRKDHRYLIGLFDVLKIAKKSYRIIFDRKGRIIVTEISEKESQIKPCKILGKTVLGKNKIQFNLHDGKNIIVKTDAKVGDTLLLKVPQLEIIETLPLKKGVTVFLTKGKHSGDVGLFKEIKKGEAIYSKGKEEIETAKEYLFVIGKEKALLEIKN
ncbi:30S ribosomal protein S4e [Candidatus Woesearchaeota archaeon]|jgi:small subunit ribosomal protein S4e|nr:30S ribosomal protein S4e [Candidatus Woesearchaeota archaeon]